MSSCNSICVTDFRFALLSVIEGPSDAIQEGQIRAEEDVMSVALISCKHDKSILESTSFSTPIFYTSPYESFNISREIEDVINHSLTRFENSGQYPQPGLNIFKETKQAVIPFTSTPLPLNRIISSRQELSALVNSSLKKCESKFFSTSLNSSIYRELELLSWKSSVQLAETYESTKYSCEEEMEDTDSIIKQYACKISQTSFNQEPISSTIEQNIQTDAKPFSTTSKNKTFKLSEKVIKKLFSKMLAETRKRSFEIFSESENKMHNTNSELEDFCNISQTSAYSQTAPASLVYSSKPTTNNPEYEELNRKNVVEELQQSTHSLSLPIESESEPSDLNENILIKKQNENKSKEKKNVSDGEIIPRAFFPTIDQIYGNYIPEESDPEKQHDTPLKKRNKNKYDLAFCPKDNQTYRRAFFPTIDQIYGSNSSLDSEMENQKVPKKRKRKRLKRFFTCYTCIEKVED